MMKELDFLTERSLHMQPCVFGDIVKGTSRTHTPLKGHYSFFTVKFLTNYTQTSTWLELETIAREEGICILSSL